MLLIALFYILAPLLLIGIITFIRQPNKLIWIFTILPFGSFIFYLWMTARWEVVGIYFRPIIPILFLIACIIGYKRIKKPKTPPKKIITILGITVNLVIIIFFSGLNWFSIKGYTTPKNTIDLVSPFRNGKQIVLHGGVSPFLNGHFHVKPQNYAIDIVGLNNIGMRASSITGGSNLNNYVIYGEPIYSPCKGTVAIVVDKYDDQAPPKTDREHLAGNHVLIEYEGVEILLAHLKKGSIKVSVGDTVNTNTLLGQVGNTGNTSEPHLHMHVEKGGDIKTILNGVAVPFTINKRFLTRGAILKH